MIALPFPGPTVPGSKLALMPAEFPAGKDAARSTDPVNVLPRLTSTGTTTSRHDGSATVAAPPATSTVKLRWIRIVFVNDLGSEPADAEGVAVTVELREPLPGHGRRRVVGGREPQRRGCVRRRIRDELSSDAPWRSLAANVMSPVEPLMRLIVIGTSTDVPCRTVTVPRSTVRLKSGEVAHPAS